MRRYYSAESEHGSDTSMGFCNDTIVKAFSSKASRDQYVADSSNISVAAIPAREATAHAANQSMTTSSDGKPRSFTGEFWGVVDYGSEFNGNESREGFIGTLEVCGNGNIPESCVVSRFY